MCDYSLMIVPNRLAIEGEDLVAHKFQSGTTGSSLTQTSPYGERSSAQRAYGTV